MFGVIVNLIAVLVRAQMEVPWIDHPPKPPLAYIFIFIFPLSRRPTIFC